jgi:hypothetical protein
LEPDDILPGVDDRSRICGVAFPVNEQTAILINRSGNCSNDLHTLIGHEISHFGIGNACNETGEGHGPPFWAWFRGFATRYRNEVPDGDWNNPSGRIASHEQRYIDRGTRICKGNSDVSGDPAGYFFLNPDR